MMADMSQLGGKSPVIVTECANLKIIARRMFSIKQLVNGQMCGRSTI